MSSFTLLDQREEDGVHKHRLLLTEERPFKRVARRLLTPGSLVSTPSKLPTPPPSTTGEEVSQEAERQKQLDDRREFREDVLMDFAAFDSSIARLQFLRNSNERERERYNADKERILETMNSVRESTATLRIQLDESRATMEQRKKFDKLAEKITNNKLLRPREDQEINLKKLEEECRELEKESRAYGVTWKERREQFGRIVEEGMQLRRLIRDEKEEVERREGMDGGEEDGEVGESGGQTPKHSSISGGATPRPDSQQDGSLKPQAPALGSLSRSGSRSNSLAPSPAPAEEGEDSAMGDALKVPESEVAPDTPMAEAEAETQAEVSTPRVTIEEPSEDGAVEEGEAKPEDKMDTT